MMSDKIARNMLGSLETME